MKYKIILILLIGSVLWSCSTPLPEVRGVKKTDDAIYESNLRIYAKRIYVWINRMPGANRKDRLHVTGELDFFDDTHYNLKTIKIKEIKILQKDEIIYQFSPLTEVKYVGEKKEILFSTVKGLLLSARMDTGKKIKLKIHLFDGENDMFFLIPDVKINEVL